MNAYTEDVSPQGEASDQELDALLAAADASMLRGLEESTDLDAGLAEIFRTVVVPENVEDKIKRERESERAQAIVAAFNITTNGQVSIFVGRLRGVLAVLEEIRGESGVPEPVTDFVDACETDLEMVMRGLSDKTLGHDEARNRLQRVLENVRKCRNLLVHEGEKISDHPMMGRVKNLFTQAARALEASVPATQFLFDFCQDGVFEPAQ
ncbi:hypothetical protein AB0K71_29010 [Streptomyces syringium]|uniref:hypothetical protein n=1 Tax=Streptomyces syringium TaxID=76729 RepID=UPI00341FE41C